MNAKQTPLTPSEESMDRADYADCEGEQEKGEMTDTKRTPQTPYRIGKNGIDIIGADDFDVLIIAGVRDMGEAEVITKFVTTACNAYDALVEVLEMVVNSGNISKEIKALDTGKYESNAEVIITDRVFKIARATLAKVKR